MYFSLLLNKSSGQFVHYTITHTKLFPDELGQCVVPDVSIILHREKERLPDLYRIFMVKDKKFATRVVTSGTF